MPDQNQSAALAAGDDVAVSASIRRAIFNITLGSEGKLSVNPKDPGNWTGGKVAAGVLKGTKFGISAASYPTVDIVNLTIDQAWHIYEWDFYRPSGCDRLPWCWALAVFDAAINEGAHTAGKLMQEALGVKIDGDIGSVTIAAAQHASSDHLYAFFALRALRYEGDKNADEFAKGWLIRTYHICWLGALGIPTA